MKDGKEMETCDCTHHHGMWGGKHVYMLIGTLALVYGLVMWAMATYMWPSYMGWIVGGILLILVGWLKKWFYMKKGM
ncbi:MAG TPA: hypothetical protein VF189_04000 [Patescibacteria group bacterium]